MSSTLAQDTVAFNRSFVSITNAFSGFRGYQAESNIPEVDRTGYDIILSSDFRALYNSYIIKNYLSVGAGAAVSRTYHANFNQLWGFIDLRGYFSDEKNTIYIFINLGKSWAINDLWLDGQGGGVGVGYRFEWEETLFSVEINPFNRSVSFDNKRYRNSDDKMIIFGTNIGISVYF